MMSHSTLEHYYQVLFMLAHHHHYSITEIEDMIIYERDLFTQMIVNNQST